MDINQNSKEVKSIKIEVVNDGKTNMTLSTQLSDSETIRIIRECLKLLEKEEKEVSRDVIHYNLQMIISVGFKLIMKVGN